MVDQEKIHNQCLSNDPEERIHALEELNDFFSLIPDKQQAWNDLHRLIKDENRAVRSKAAEALGSAFSQVPDKQQAWNDLHRLINDQNSSVRFMAASALGYAFYHVPDKQQAWNDLHRLTNDEKNFVRYIATSALDFAFSQVPDKQQAWNDLHRLTNNKNRDERYWAAQALGSAFSQVPDKQQAWNDLHRLTNNKNREVRTFSNHSLGKVSIFMASQAETDEDYKKELEKAIEFFEIATKEEPYYNPAQFCLPFYRSFHAIIFEKQEAKEEVTKYLEEAKSAIKGSESKKKLLKAVENLAKALTEVQNLRNLDLEVKREKLNFYRQYCDHAAELINDTEEQTPFATAVLRKGLPILDRNLKEILKEIQKKARTAYTESIGTEVEETAHAVCKEVQKWEIGSQEYLLTQIENLVDLLKSYIPKIKENNLILNKIDMILLESDIVKQYMLLSNLIPQIIDIKISKEMKELRGSVDKLTASIGELQNPQKDLDNIKRDLKEIKDYMPGMKEQIDGVLSQLNSSSSTATQKLEFALPIIPSIITYKVEANAPKLVDDIKNRFKNLVLKPKNK